MSTAPDYSQEVLLDLLCKFFTGRDRQSFSDSEQEKVLNEIFVLMYDYTLTELTLTHDPKDVVRFQQTVATGNAKLLDTFPESSTALQQTLLKMLTELA